MERKFVFKKKTDSCSTLSSLTSNSSTTLSSNASNSTNNFLILKKNSFVSNNSTSPSIKHALPSSSAPSIIQNEKSLSLTGSISSAESKTTATNKLSNFASKVFSNKINEKDAKSRVDEMSANSSKSSSNSLLQMMMRNTNKSKSPKTSLSPPKNKKSNSQIESIQVKKRVEKICLDDSDDLDDYLNMLSQTNDDWENVRCKQQKKPTSSTGNQIRPFMSSNSTSPSKTSNKPIATIKPQM